MPVLLDSTILIDCLRGRPAVSRVRALAQAGERLLTSPVNIEEVVRGLKEGEADGARRLFSGLQIVDLGPDHGWRAGRWRAEFAASGITLSQADCLIAASAFLARAKLATGNPKHFPMAGLEIEHWQVGRL